MRQRVPGTAAELDPWCRPKHSLHSCLQGAWATLVLTDTHALQGGHLHPPRPYTWGWGAGDLREGPLPAAPLTHQKCRGLTSGGGRAGLTVPRRPRPTFPSASCLSERISPRVPTDLPWSESAGETTWAGGKGWSWLQAWGPPSQLPGRGPRPCPLVHMALGPCGPRRFRDSDFLGQQTPDGSLDSSMNPSPPRVWS